MAERTIAYTAQGVALTVILGDDGQGKLTAINGLGRTFQDGDWTSFPASAAKFTTVPFRSISELKRLLDGVPAA